MADQKMRLDKLSINSCYYNSSLGIKSKKEVEKNLEASVYQIMYTMPETLVT